MTPVLHLLAGSNGAGKSTYAQKVLMPRSHLQFVNADVIATELWPGAEETNAYSASKEAAKRRDDLIAARRSFITESVFSHESKVDLVRQAQRAGYEVSLHVVMVPLKLTEARVLNRVENGGHAVPADKVRARYERLWELVARARTLADFTYVYDNSRTVTPFKLVASYTHGLLDAAYDYPSWAPLPV